MRKQIIKFLLFTGLTGLIIYIAFRSFINQKPEKSRYPETNIIVSPLQPQAQTIFASLEEKVTETLLGTKNNYGIAIKNLRTGGSYYFNEHKEFEPGSLYKIWILATAFNQIENGRLKEDEVLNQEIAILNEKFHISSESAELTEGQITLTVKEAMEQMITISDNYSALLLAERIRLSTVKAFLQGNNFNESSLGEPPKTTPYDIALFFEKLYKGELASQENADKMLDILKRQTLNSKLPRYLPENTLIAHKTGEIGYFSHDAGIVYSPSGNYIIVVLSESEIPSQADERIARISRAVYDYFTKESEN